MFQISMFSKIRVISLFWFISLLCIIIIIIINMLNTMLFILCDNSLVFGIIAIYLNYEEKLIYTKESLG